MSKIDTRISRLFNIDYPIIQGGMIWVSGWKLAVAVSRAGGLGLIGSGSMTPELLNEHISKAKSVWDGPIGVNISIVRGDAAEMSRVVVDSGVKIVFTSAGNPGKFTQYFHDNGIIVAHVVPSLKLAEKAVSRGVDVVVGEGTEAGGHNGFEEIPTFPLIPRLADHLDVPIIAAGGIRDGRGLAAAFALGAEGVQVGTRFACTVESSASDEYKRAILHAGEPATILALRKLIPTRMLQGKFTEQVRQVEADGGSVEDLSALLGQGRAKNGIFLGNLDPGYMEAGEVAGDIDELTSAGNVVASIVSEYSRVIGHLPQLKSTTLTPSWVPS